MATLIRAFTYAERRDAFGDARRIDKLRGIWILVRLPSRPPFRLGQIPENYLLVEFDAWPTAVEILDAVNLSTADHVLDLGACDCATCSATCAVAEEDEA